MKIRGRAKNQREMKFNAMLTKMDKRIKQQHKEEINNLEFVSDKQVINLTDHINKKLNED